MRAEVSRMHTGRAEIVLSSLLSCLLCGLLVAQGSSPANDGGPFTRGALVPRFDADKDGKLDANERVALLDAFGIYSTGLQSAKDAA